MAVASEDPSAEAADECQPVLCGVDEDQLVDDQRVLQSGEPVDQFRCVRRSAADDRQLHPLTPVNVTPSMNAFCARKNTSITGAMTRRVAAIVRFQSVWWALLNDPRP